MSLKIGITSATGNLGLTTLKYFAETLNKDKFSLRVAAFDKSKHLKSVENFCDKHRVRCFTFDCDRDDQMLETFVQECHVLIIIPTRSPDRVAHARKYIDAAKKYNVDNVIMYSFIREKNSKWGQHYQQIEELIENSGINYTFIRTPVHMQSLYLFAPDIAKGVLPLPIGRGSAPWVHVRDVARAAKVIVEEQKSSNFFKAFHITGPSLLDGQTLASVASNTLNIRVEYRNITEQAARNLLVDSGLESWLVEEFIYMFQDIRDGKLQYVNQLFSQLTGEESKHISQFFVENRKRFTHPEFAYYPEGMLEVEEEREERERKTERVTTTSTSVPISHRESRKVEVIETMGGGSGTAQYLLSSQDLQSGLDTVDECLNQESVALSHLNFLISRSNEVMAKLQSLKQELLDLHQQV
ncbi:hypothetical protein MP228_009918 [Amoeboaphelidium protococcarum]|nr:hypothetical protein MP228_009918 [Amoeboaphelidium protococcarum]